MNRSDVKDLQRGWRAGAAKDVEAKWDEEWSLSGPDTFSVIAERRRAGDSAGCLDGCSRRHVCRGAPVNQVG